MKDVITPVNEEFLNLKSELLECEATSDLKSSLIHANVVLMKVALNTSLSQKQRQHLVKIYIRVKYPAKKTIND